MQISFDKSYKEALLSKLGIIVGKDNFLINKKTKLPIKDTNGEPITYDQFAGYEKGSVKFYKKDLSSLIKLSKSIQRNR